jgi:protease-4
MELPPTPPPPRRSTVGFWVVIVLLLSFLLVSVAANFGLALGLVTHRASTLASFHKGGEDEFPSLAETWSYGSGKVKAARIPVEGVIERYAEDGLFSEPVDMVTSILRQIRAATNDEDVKAIILEVDSPGGGITPSDEIWNALADFRDSAEDRRIVVFMRDLAASGGYYVAMSGDWLIAEPTTIVGSIGVIMSTLNIKDLSQKIGIKDVTIKSGANKDLLNPFSDVPPEQIKLLQEVIDSSYSRFYNIVKDARGFEDDQLKPLADGRIWDSNKALELGFIDEVGYWEDAVAKTAELLDEENVKVVRYESKETFFDLITRVRTPNLLASLRDSVRPRVMYLWTP